MIRRTLAILASLSVLGASVVFLFTGSMKLQDTALFEKTLISQGVLNAGQAAWLAPTIGLGETLVGAWALYTLLAASRPDRAAYLLAFAFLVLAAYCWALVAIPPPKPTGCGCGTSRHAVLSWTPLALRNTGVAGLCLVSALPLRRARAAGLRG